MSVAQDIPLRRVRFEFPDNMDLGAKILIDPWV